DRVDRAGVQRARLAKTGGLVQRGLWELVADVDHARRDSRSAARAPQHVCRSFAPRQSAPSFSLSSSSSFLSCASASFCCSMLRTEVSTVVWCLPPNFSPMTGNEASVSVRHRYI